MTAKNPVVIPEATLVEDTWVKIAEGVKSGIIFPLKDDVVYYQTHRITPVAPEDEPSDTLTPADDDFEGVVIYYRLERIAGESVVIDGASVTSTVPRDIYVYCQGGAGRVRFDRGD
jgi:hypothetical protein